MSERSLGFVRAGEPIDLVATTAAAARHALSMPVGKWNRPVGDTAAHPGLATRTVRPCGRAAGRKFS